MGGKLVLMRAVVDIGSNSTKFLIELSQRGAEAAYATGSAVTRLGRGVHVNHRFDTASLADTVRTLESFSQQFAEKGCKDVTVVGTSAVRDAQDRDLLGQHVQRIFGVPLRVLSGLEEAQFSMKGAALAARHSFGNGPLVFCEVGGASSQVGMMEPRFSAHSFQAGAVRCHEGLGLENMPVSDSLWAQAQNQVPRYFPEPEWQSLLQSWSMNSGDLNSARAVAIGGSLMLAAKVAGARPVGDRGYLFTRTEMQAFNNRFRKLSMPERLQLPLMEPGRADVMCAALLCLHHILTRIGKEEFFITSWGLRHGLIAP